MKLIVQAIIVFLVIGIFIFAYSVWPTPWIYNSWANTIYDPKTSKNLGIATAYRQSRLTGRLEAKYHGQWHSVFCGIDTCVVNDAK